jgi:hypothetical protein
MAVDPPSSATAPPELAPDAAPLLAADPEPDEFPEAALGPEEPELPVGAEEPVLALPPGSPDDALTPLDEL